MEKFLSIGQLAKSSGINMTKIRYYERRGLLPANSRSGSGYRRYLNDALSRIEFIKKTQSLDFTLEEILVLINLKNNTFVDGCTEVKQRIEIKLQQIEDKLEDLQRMKRELKDLHAQCRHEFTSDECPLLQCCKEHIAFSSINEQACNG